MITCATSPAASAGGVALLWAAAADGCDVGAELGLLGAADGGVVAAAALATGAVG
jgi:hypothetical protein